MPEKREPISERIAQMRWLEKVRRKREPPVSIGDASLRILVRAGARMSLNADDPATYRKTMQQFLVVVGEGAS